VAKLDALDYAIIDILQHDARTSSRSAARQLGVSAGTVGQRIGRLEQAGVITGYSAIVDPAHLGRHLAFVVGLQMSQSNAMEEALNELICLPEIDEVLVLTGRWDLMVLGRVAGPKQLNELLTKELWQSPSFRHSETMLIIDGRSKDGRTKHGGAGGDHEENLQ